MEIRAKKTWEVTLPGPSSMRNEDTHTRLLVTEENDVVTFMINGNHVQVDTAEKIREVGNNLTAIGRILITLSGGATRAAG